MNIPDKRTNPIGEYAEYKEAQFKARKIAVMGQIDLIQCSSLTKEDKDILLLDLTSLIKGAKL